MRRVPSLWATMALVACAWLMVTAVPSRGQVTPEEHAQHHLEGAGPTESARGGPPGTRGMSGGDRGGMGGMMEQMGAPAPKDLYPSLMNLPSLSPEQQDEIRNQARERISAGVTMWSAGLDRLTEATQTQDRAAMHEALGQMREGIDQFESGLAAEQALAAGRAPREVALEWFKQNMNLLPPAGPLTGFRLWGMGVFHTFIMAGLVLFAAVVIWMYFVKMRRAANLLAALTGGAAAVAPPRTAPAVLPTYVGTAAPTVEQPPREFTPSRPWSGKLRLCHVFQETHDVKTFRFMNPLGGSMPFIHLPGQFCTLTVAPGGKPVKRNYTLACSPTQHDCIEITVKCDGLVSDYLHNVAQPADLLEIAAPYGSFIFTGREAPSVILISGGVGITPLMSVTRYLTDRSWPGDIFFLYACRSPKDFIYREEVEYLQRRHANLHLTVTVSNAERTDWQGPVGRITKEFVTQCVPEIATRHVHICGPPGMMEAIKQILAELGVPKEQVKTEAFGLAQGRPVREAAPAATEAQGETGGKQAALPTVTFTRSGKSAPLPPDKTILDIAEEAGVEIDYSCRTGVCGTCKVKRLSGQVTMEVEDSLEPEEKAQGIILACQARSTGDVEVEA